MDILSTNIYKYRFFVSHLNLKCHFSEIPSSACRAPRKSLASLVDVLRVTDGGRWGESPEDLNLWALGNLVWSKNLHESLHGGKVLTWRLREIKKKHRLGTDFGNFPSKRWGFSDGGLELLRKWSLLLGWYCWWKKKSGVYQLIR